MMWRPSHTAYKYFFTLFLAVLACACSDLPVEEQEAHAEEEEHQEGVVRLDPQVIERLGIRTKPVSNRALAGEIETTGQVDFEQDRLAHVTPRIPGRVDQAFANLGDQVQKGQVLAVIDSIELGQAKSAFLQVTAQENLARQNFEREKGLFADRISSEKEMLVAQAAHLEAIARLENTRETLRLYGLNGQQIDVLASEPERSSLLPVRAPLTGKVVEKHVSVGELVTPERNMFTIADLAHVWVWIDVYEQDLRHVHLEDGVEVVVDAFPGETFNGKLSYLSDQVDSDTRTVRARIDVPNTNLMLRPGMFARVRISDPHPNPEGGEPERVLVVPESAVQRDGEIFIVFVSLGEGRFERRVVTTGRKVKGFLEILSGLASSESVVTNGVFLLKSEASKTQMGAGHGH